MDEATHETGHETRDVSLRPVVLGVTALFASAALAALLMWGLLGHYEDREARRSPAPNPLALTGAPALPPEPRLQTRPLDDLRTLRARDQSLLDGYGWVDRRAGVVRIPIDRAIDLLAERGR